MSCEHFETLLCADVRSLDGKTCEYAPAFTGIPRWNEEKYNNEAWVCCHLHAHDVLNIVADTIASSPMNGITGDHLEKRIFLSGLLDTLADGIRLLAADAAHDGTLDERKWELFVHSLLMKLNG